MARKRIGELLIDAGIITEQQLAAALAYQKQFGGRVGRILVEKKLVPEDRLVRMLSAQLGIPVGDLPLEAPPPALLQLIPRDVALSSAVFPIGVRKDPRGDLVFLAMADPTNTEVIERLQLATGKHVMPFIAGELAIERAALKWLPAGDAAPPTAGADRDEIPLVTGILSTPPQGVAMPTTEKVTFGAPGTFLGDESAEADGTMPPPVDFDQLTLAGPALLQPPSAPPEPPASPAPTPPLAEVPPVALAEVLTVEKIEAVEKVEVLEKVAVLEEIKEVERLEELEEAEPLELVEPDDAPTATCPDCHAERIAEARFCPHCGCSFTGARRAAEARPAAARPPALPRLRSAGGASMASRQDDVDVLLAETDAPLIARWHGVNDLPSDAALIDEPAALAGGVRGIVGEPRAAAPSPRQASSLMARADHPDVLVAEAPRRRSLAADWADVAERPIARKEHGTADLAVQRGRDLLLVAAPLEEPADPAPEPQVLYEPAAPLAVVDPAPWAAFAGPDLQRSSEGGGGAPPTDPPAPPDPTEKK